MNRETTLTVLEEARELIADEQHWCRDADARDSLGRIVAVDAPRAVAWCALGALARRCIDRGLGGSIQMQALMALAHTADILVAGPVFKTVPAYNDAHTHAEVLDLFDRTIARLRQEAP